MTSSRRIVSSLAVVFSLLAGGCKRTPSDHTPEGTLALLQSSLATHSPALERVADVRIVAEARALLQSKDVQERFGVPITTSGFQAVLREHERDMQPAVFFAGFAPLLRQGHCVRIGDAPVPDMIHPAPEPGEQWPRAVLDVQASVARRARNAVAGDYRCDGGPSFGVAFVHPYPDDGTWRVAYVGPSRHR